MLEWTIVFFLIFAHVLVAATDMFFLACMLQNGLDCSKAT